SRCICNTRRRGVVWSVESVKDAEEPPGPGDALELVLTSVFEFDPRACDEHWQAASSWPECGVFEDPGGDMDSDVGATEFDFASGEPWRGSRRHIFSHT